MEKDIAKAWGIEPAGRPGLPSYLADLNDDQLRCVTTSEGYLRVIAGAGTGKTRVLTRRYAFLVEGLGIDPANIACVTFTNKAAAEMRHRIRELIGDGHDTSLICTFHSLACRILREDIDHLMWPKAFQIIDREQKKAILAEIYERRGLKMDAGSFEKVIDRIEALKVDPAYLDGMLSPDHVPIHPDVQSFDDQLVEDYLQQQKRDFLLDFDDLMNFAQHLLDTCAEVRKKWQLKINYLQIDEFQDSDGAEVRFADALSGYFRNVMVVGDPDQNVYEWRGSDVRLLVEYDRDHSPCSTMLLTQNYRSTPQILTCANALVEKNRLRIPKDLVANRAPGAPVVHLHAPNENEETAWTAQHMRRLHEGGVAWSDMAVLFRAAYISRAIEKRLVDEGIPYEMVGGVRFLQRMEVADAVAYLRLAAFGDDRSFKRMANVPRRKMGKARLQFLEGARGESADVSLLETLRAHLDAPELKGSGARKLLDLADDLHDRMSALGVADFVDYTLAATGYEAYIRELGDADRLDNLAEFKRMAHDFEADAGEDVTLYDFLDALALQSDLSLGDDACDRVRLMTVHAAKGLEFPVVFLAGMTEGVFPASRTVEERKAEGLEEERRLCYVAITRARDLLVLTDSEGSGGPRATNRAPKIPSRFLSEMGEANYERVGTMSEACARSWRRLLEANQAASLAERGGWEGMRIVHPAFGPGTIAEQDQSGSSWRVDFDNLPTPRYLSTQFLARLVEEQHTSPGSVSVQATVVESAPDEVVVDPE